MGLGLTLFSTMSGWELLAMFVGLAVAFAPLPRPHRKRKKPWKLPHRHINPDGSKGGWVGPRARVYGGVLVERGAIVRGSATVDSSAQILAGARVSGEVLVCQRARVCRDAMVSGVFEIRGDAIVGPGVTLHGSGSITRHTIVLSSPAPGRKVGDLPGRVRDRRFEVVTDDCDS